MLSPPKAFSALTLRVGSPLRGSTADMIRLFGPCLTAFFWCKNAVIAGFLNLGSTPIPDLCGDGKIRQNGWQGTVEAGANGAQQFGFGYGQFAIVRDCIAHSLDEAALTSAVNSH